MVERFNRRLAEAIAAKPSVGSNEGKNKFLTHAERNTFLQNFVARYNQTRLRCLDYQAPAALVANPPGHNTKAGYARSVVQAAASQNKGHELTLHPGHTMGADQLNGPKAMFWHKLLAEAKQCTKINVRASLLSLSRVGGTRTCGAPTQKELILIGVYAPPKG